MNLDLILPFAQKLLSIDHEFNLKAITIKLLEEKIYIYISIHPSICLYKNLELDKDFFVESKNY